MNYTSLDIIYAVGRLNMYTSNPNNEHCNALIKVSRYLRYIPDWRIHYTRFSTVLEGYCGDNLIQILMKVNLRLDMCLL